MLKNHCIIEVACGGKHTLFLNSKFFTMSCFVNILDQGHVFVCGLNDYGQLGI
jgi:alpha-tubulin suppressor-like RCC1 family protein